ncbi:Protein OSCP1 [Gryllus bimaculatus]|nr:Protein OSCP1 [Gryllus bimaculatus]
MSSVHTVPLLFLNLGGEMLYILDQRLTAQRIAKDKSIKVMNDIVGIMFNDRFLKELFKPQEVYNKHALRKLFEDLAHASIMRLNKASMDKLYDLMTMTFKYQLFMASQPLDILFITLNHLDAVRSFVPSPYLQKQIDFAYEMLIDKYGHMTLGELQNIRYCLLNFFQDLKVRVSVFLKQGVQQDDGKFLIPASGHVPSGYEVPGCIRIFGWDGQLIQERPFENNGAYIAAAAAGSLDKRGNRGTKLGCNIYREHPNPSSESSLLQEAAPQSCQDRDATEMATTDVPAVGREELNLLMAQDTCEASQQKGTVNIDAISHPRSAVLDQIYGELTIEEPPEEDGPQDIVDMLDNLL